MYYNRDSVPHFVVKESSCGSVNIIDHGDHFVLYNSGDRWMVYNKETDIEIKETYSSYDLAYGDVLISGLGFGILALWLCNKPEVKSVTVIEVSNDVISLFNQSNISPDKLTIINDNMITYNTDKEYDVLLLDHYETQDFDWRLEDIKSISSRIKHKYLWSWSLEAIYLLKMYRNEIDEDALNAGCGLDTSNIDFTSMWGSFIDIFLPQEIMLKSIHGDRLNEYLFSYFDKK